MRDETSIPGADGAVTPPRAAAAAMAVAAGIAAAVLPGNPLGLNAFLVAVAVTASVAMAAPRRIDGVVVALSVLGLGLAAMTFVTAAEWVAVVSTVAALGLAAVVVVDARTWGAIVRAPFVVFSRVPRAFPFLARGLIGEKVGDRWLTTSPAVRGVLLGAGLVAVFGTLFASADRAFAHLVEEYLVPDLSVLPLRVLVFGFVALAGASLAAAGSRYAALGAPWGIGVERVLSSAGRTQRRLRPLEWTVGLVAVDLLFAAFVTLQVATLFGGHDHVLRTAGLTYAEYAREGFFQLLAAAGLTLVVVAAMSAVADRSARGQDLRLRALLGVLCALTLVVLASAMYRLQLYEAAFGFTRARVAAHAVMLWMAAMFVLVLIVGGLRRTVWLPRAVLGLTAGSVLLFAALRPDAIVAEANVERFRSTGAIDLSYARTLSPDAVPALATLPPRLRACALEDLATELARQDPAIAWNLGRSRAGDALAAIAPLPPCRPTRTPMGTELTPG